MHVKRTALRSVAKVEHCVLCSFLRVPALPKDIPAGPITGKGNLRGNLIDCSGDQVNSTGERQMQTDR